MGVDCVLTFGNSAQDKHDWSSQSMAIRASLTVE
jgi:hypothetical protein